MITRRKLLSTGIALALAGAFPMAHAGEVAEGTVLSAANIDSLKNETLDGKPIGSLLTEKMEWRIRNNGWKLPLHKAKEIPLDAKWVKASKANVGKTKINPQTREIEGWEAGEPFPDVQSSDPQVAEKLIWNYHLGQLAGDVATAKTWTQLLIDGKKGIHAEPIAEFTRYNMKGRLGGKSVEGDGKEKARQLLFFKEPAEMKGLGTFTIMYDSAQVPDAWVYVPAVRRVRRLSGGAWMDPVGSSDQLQDDLEIFNARPSWYKSYKLLGKRWVLAVAHAKTPAWNPKGKAFNERYPVLEQGEPHWNMNNDRFEPREVWVIEAVTPDVHPYSKKVLYMDTKYPRIYYGEAFNRKGEFWKFMEFHSFAVKGEDGFQSYQTSGGAIIDFQRNHATVFLTDPTQWFVNQTKVKSSDVSLGQLEAAGR
ncbi:DUF1329 domain-containing protein [Denitratisoma oestradiolicum]|uniref:Outer membrane lipoprotein-sorting protein n=1 Tax=Denitratisoma oestradiolicum TaxID=311182 RepID=A0A6S6XUD1_9PROT|nr:DUF1329 domain-containing protein [Denitratisoma oestradiolicum]TWO79467.1 outer membrane lipoprotein-sorting protein [Denitratisoma oestradiolicum]CAB1368440.1 Outer membrane lipoprotein-sorting protein [Denitratisoma oestradiolicum]